MSMINCPECQHEVSNGARKCPNCGYQLNEPKRTIFGKVIKWSFILFNVVMAWWFIGGVGGAAEMTSSLDGAEQVGAAIGTGIGAVVIGSIWFFGDFILGLFLLLTRPK